MAGLLRHSKKISGLIRCFTELPAAAPAPLSVAPVLGNTLLRELATTGKDTAPKPLKRPATAYSLFLKEVFPRLKKEHPDKTFTEVSVMVAKQWSSTPEANKKAYADKYKAARAEYDAIPRPPKAVKLKPPGSGYAVYVSETFNEVMADHPSMSAVEVMKEVSRLWKQVPEAEKAARSAEALKLKAEYIAVHGKIERKPRKSQAKRE